MSAQARPTGTGSRVLDDLAEVIGLDAACALAFRFRGLRLYVPKNPAGDPRIAEAIGDELAARLCDAFYRTTIPMPAREVERRMVHRLAGEGLTRQAIAERLHITERQVYRLLESAAPLARSGRQRRSTDPRQMDLL